MPNFIAVGHLSVYKKDPIYILRIDVFESKESDQRTLIDNEIINSTYIEHVGRVRFSTDDNPHVSSAYRRSVDADSP